MDTYYIAAGPLAISVYDSREEAEEAFDKLEDKVSVEGRDENGVLLDSIVLDKNLDLCIMSEAEFDSL